MANDGEAGLPWPYVRCVHRRLSAAGGLACRSVLVRSGVGEITHLQKVLYTKHQVHSRTVRSVLGVNLRTEIVTPPEQRVLLSK